MTWNEHKEQAAELKRIAVETGVPIVVSMQKPVLLDVKPGEEYEINTDEGTITKLRDPE